MFVVSDKAWKSPIKIWLEKREDMEESCFEQARHLAELPFLHKWVCLMPDTHTGKGMPIGGVIAAKQVLIPNAVGVDIGCGMAWVGTNIKTEEIREIVTGNGSLIQGMVGDILRNVPVGFAHHKTAMPCFTLDRAFEEFDKYEEDGELLGQLDAGYFQVGTLGGGNHFIELQEDEEGYLSVMIHSGSRHMGKAVCDYFHQKARELNGRWYSQVPDEYRLAFLPLDTSSSGPGRFPWGAPASGHEGGKAVFKLDAAFHGFRHGKQGENDAGREGSSGEVDWQIYGFRIELYRGDQLPP